MVQPLYPPSGPQSVAEVLDTGFRIFQRSLIRCLPYGALSMIVGQVQNIYSIAAGHPPTRFGGGDPVWIALFVVGILFTLYLWIALILRQYSISVGQPASMRQELRQALRRLPPYLLLLLVGLGIALLAGLVVGGVYIATGRNNVPMIVAGLLIVSIPVAYVLTPVTLATPAVVLDGKNGFSAVAYAARLVRHNWWRATTVLTVAVVVLVVFYLVTTVLVMLALPLFARVDLASITAATTVVYVVLGGVSLPYVNGTVLALYGDLKIRREGLDLEQRVASVAQT